MKKENQDIIWLNRNGRDILIYAIPGMIEKLQPLLLGINDIEIAYVVPKSSKKKNVSNLSKNSHDSINNR